MDKFTEATVYGIVNTSCGITMMLKLVDTETVIPIFVDERESDLMLNVLNKETPASQVKRIYESLIELGAAVNFSMYRAEIYGIQDGIFRSNVVFAMKSPTVHLEEERLLVLEVSVVDACIVALLSGSPICVSETVIQDVGTPVSDIFIESFKK
jgi:bifunctional DNase/RNase